MISLKSIYTNNNIVTFYSDEKPPLFRNPALQKKMARDGIKIPPEQASFFNNKSVVYLEDPQFKQAFLSIYFKKNFNENEYKIEST